MYQSNYKKYKNNLNSPINYKLYRKALCTQLIMEGRHYGRFKGLMKLMVAIYYYPLNYKAWRSIYDLLLRSMKKLINLDLLNKSAYCEKE